MIFLLIGSRNCCISSLFLERMSKNLFSVLNIHLKKSGMSSFFEESERKHLESAIEEILSKFDSKVDERIILKDLISTATLLIQKKNIQ